MPNDAIKVSVEVKGFKQMRKLLTPPSNLYGEPVREAMEEIAEFGESAAISLAPRGFSGQTIARMSRKVQRKPVPLWAVVKTTAKRDGFAYPRVVNYSPYAQSRYRTGVNRNRYWFDNAMNRARSVMGRILEKAGEEMARRWRTLEAVS